MIAGTRRTLVACGLLVAMDAFAGPMVSAPIRPWGMSEEALTSRVKSLDVHTLDPALPHQRFEEWMRDVSGERALFGWESGHCGNNPTWQRDRPVCVRVGGYLYDGNSFELFIHVGTTRRGWAKAPTFSEGSMDSLGDVRPVLSLSGLAERLGAPSPCFDPIALHPWFVDRWRAEGGGTLEINPWGRFTTSNDTEGTTLMGFVRVSKSEPLDSPGDPVPVLLRFELGGVAQIVPGVLQAGEGRPRSLHLDFPGNDRGLFLRDAFRSMGPIVMFEGTSL